LKFLTTTFIFFLFWQFLKIFWELIG
jgi:hypothetical protein